MKINSIKTETSYLHSRHRNTVVENTRERSAFNLNNRINNEQINTTIKRDSDGRVSFKGANPEPLLHSFAKYVSKNPLVAEAVCAIFITCGLRPLTILATARTEEDKDKCAYQAAKSISTGVVGLAMTALVAPPIKDAANKLFETGKLKLSPKINAQNNKLIKKAVNLIKENAESITTEVDLAKLVANDKMNLDAFAAKGKTSLKEFYKILKKQVPEIAKDIKKGIEAQKSSNNYAGTAKNVFDKFFQPAFLPIRAAITIALVPMILKMAGIKKGGSKQKVEAKEPNMYSHLKTGFKTEKEKELFKTFAGVANYENK